MLINLKRKTNTLVIGLIDRNSNLALQEASLAEAELLVETYGGKVHQVITQNASHRTNSTYIGSGKVQEIKQIVESENIDIIVINNHLRASQIHNLKKVISPDDSCKIWDRTQLILQIFKNHAHTAEAKLQIRLAELEHRGAELSGIGVSMSQQGGGIGTKGLGETKTEILQRHWKKEIQMVKTKLKKVMQNRHQQMKYRKQSGIPTVSIIGYTNAGKTTLFNLISNKEDKVQDALFATLDSSVSSMYLQNVGKEIFVSDTIGFIQDLHTTLIDAFQSTLLETISADILLHVIDCSDNNMGLKIRTVNKILRKIDLGGKQQIYIFNKMDKVPETRKRKISKKHQSRKHIFISATKEEGIDSLIKLVETQLLEMGLERANHLKYLDNI